MRNQNNISSLAAAVAIACGTLLAAPAVLAQDIEATEADESVEEVVVLGRLKSGAAALTDERLELPFSADYLSFEVMARAGDSDLAAALRRVPGLTVIDGKFVYVRGLGERYSSVLVNGAAVPSPDLTRSVIPLDLFPTSIVESVKIQKSPSPDQPANFGGGTINVRTKGIPDDFVFDLSAQLGVNTISDDTGLDYPSSGSPVPQAILDANQTYRGDISTSNILSTLRFSNPDATIGEARQIQQGLLNSLDTGVGISDSSLDPDVGAKASIGNSWYFGSGEEWRFGFLLNATYDEKNRVESQRREGIGNPAINFVDLDRTVYEERTVYAANVGLDWLTDHSVEASYYVLQNDEDQVSITRGYDTNNELVDGDQKAEFNTRLEERELTLFQLSGTHTGRDTPFVSGILEAVNLEDLEFDWLWSDSTAATDIPNQTRFQGAARVNPDTGEIIAGTDTLLATTSVGRFSFLELDDDQTSWGGNFMLPVELGDTYTELSTGWWGTKKSRSYYGYNINLNAVGVQAANLAGTVSDVLDPGNLLVDNGFDLSIGTDTGNESYLAAQKVDAAYGMIDTTFGDSWRVSVGARWEDYQQTVLPVDLTDFSGNSVQVLIDQLNDPNQRLAVREDDTYLSGALTFMGAGMFGADEYQWRLSYGETVVRPDLREISDVRYQDPELQIRVGGNPLLRTSPIDNFELRGEYFYSNGDNFTVSLFYKDIDSPIERIRTAGSDDNIELTFVNAESGEVYGIEFEALKSLWDNFFVAGNVTLSDSELTIDTGAITGGPTNATRRLTGHSEWVVNTTFGFDSDSGMHSAYLNYNAFGERIFYGGVAGNDDAYQQPFHSLGLVYKFFPSEMWEVDFQIDNILDEELEFTQTNLAGTEAKLITQEIGLTVSVEATIRF